MTDPATIGVLLVEDDPDAAFLTQLYLEEAGMAVSHVPSMIEALAWMDREHEHLDVIVLDLGLPDIDGLDGLRATSENVEVPVIVLTGDGRPETRLNAERLGAHGFLVKGDFDADDLTNLVVAAVEAATHPEPNIGAQPYDGPDDAISAAFDLLARTTALECWAFVRLVSRTDLVLVRHGDGALLRPGMRVDWLPGTDFTGRASVVRDETVLRCNGDAFSAPTTLVLGLGHGHHRIGAVIGWSEATVDVDDVVLDQVSHVGRQIATAQTMEEDRSRATRRAGIAGNAANVDPLTGLGNRRAYESFLRSEESRCARLGTAGAVFVIDLDGLKAINDRDGHAAGDRYLRAGASAMTQAIRAGDAVFRTGGDEFALVAVGCDETAAPVVAGRLRELLEHHRVEASVGWQARPPAETLAAAAEVADQRMYDEKQARRAARR